MNPLMRSALVTGSAAAALITTSLFGQDAVPKQDPSPTPSRPTKVVQSTVAPPSAQEPGSTNKPAAPKGGSAVQGAATKLSEAEKNLRH